MNVQHNCFDHHCTIKAGRAVYQEREKTAQFHKTVKHTAASDLILNTAQMRDANVLNSFRTRAPALNRESVVYTSCKREVDARPKPKAAAKAAETTGAKKGKAKADRVSQGSTLPPAALSSLRWAVSIPPSALGHPTADPRGVYSPTPETAARHGLVADAGTSSGGSRSQNRQH